MFQTSGFMSEERETSRSSHERCFTPEWVQYELQSSAERSGSLLVLPRFIPPTLGVGRGQTRADQSGSSPVMCVRGDVIMF